jgi:large subunit ribosomal protein L16
MLMPKKTKYRKVQKGRMRGLSKGARTLAFGEYGLQAVEPCWMTAQQIEAVRVLLSRSLKKGGSFVLRVFPDKPITKKPAETRMGKGKGNVEYWAAVVKRGRILFEVAGIDEKAARQLLKDATYKLPIKTKFIQKETPVLPVNDQHSATLSKQVGR